MRDLPKVLLLCTLGWPLAATGAHGVPPPEPPQPGFGEDKEGVIGEAFLGMGYDSNANSGSDAERYFFYDLLPEQRDSASPYGTVGASVLGSKRIGGAWSWRTGAGGSATAYPSAHFADTGDGSVHTQLRHVGRTHRVALGVVYSARAIDQHLSDEVTAAALTFEKIHGTRLLSLAAEASRLRFPDLPERDVDTRVGRVELRRAPVPNLRWQPRFTVFAGVDEAREPDSPFNRDFWGASLGAEEVFSEVLTVDGEVGYTMARYDAAFVAPERRSDEGWQARLLWRIKTDAASRWQHSFGARYRRNDSTEPLYEFERVVVGYEIARSWGEPGD